VTPMVTRITRNINPPGIEKAGFSFINSSDYQYLYDITLIPLVNRRI
jgi:hypothetical protein